jgi:hypothetical protein
MCSIAKLQNELFIRFVWADIFLVVNLRILNDLPLNSASVVPATCGLLAMLNCAARTCSHELTVRGIRCITMFRTAAINLYP